MPNLGGKRGALWSTSKWCIRYSVAKLQAFRAKTSGLFGLTSVSYDRLMTFKGDHKPIIVCK